MIVRSCFVILLQNMYNSTIEYNNFSFDVEIGDDSAYIGKDGLAHFTERPSRLNVGPLCPMCPSVLHYFNQLGPPDSGTILQLL